MSRLRSHFIITACICLAGVCAEQPARIPDPGDTGSSITFFDVGQGDAALYSDGEIHILVDGGDYGSADPLVAMLRAAGVDTLALVVLSHPHADHYGGLGAVLREFSVREFVHNGMTGGSDAFGAFMRLVRDTLGVPDAVVRRSDTRVYGGTDLVVVHPAEVLMAGEDSVNDNSVVCRIDAGGHSVLFTGDVSAHAESLLVAVAAPELAAGLLKVPHHGSRYSSCSLFLDAVGPDAAVVSCGADNGYGHPHAEALERYEEAGIAVRRTDVEGTVIFEF